ncbi:MAG: HK97-gp10 family putative phage morphogenesis protein [Burkholderiaceae bacterium]
MAKTVSMQMTGLRELGLAMKELDSRVQKRIAASAVSAGARVIAKDAKEKAPVDSGDLKRSIRSKTLRAKKPGVREAIVEAKTHGKNSAPYWHIVEFGSVNMSAKPFLRPAFESKKAEAANRIKDRLSKRLDAEAAKIGSTIGGVK